MDVHGRSYHGFDGFASQLVDANPGFDFARFCANWNLRDCLPRKMEGVKREEFIKEMFPDAKDQDPDLEAYRWLSVGLACTKRDTVSTDNPKR